MTPDTSAPCCRQTLPLGPNVCRESKIKERMPEVTRFFGIVIRMYFRDHSPAHFHAEYGEYEAPR